jgi:hypothetical protein
MNILAGIRAGDIAAPLQGAFPRYPDLICIGSQKAATTWLHRSLAGHPDVFAPILKEVHYFDTLHVPRQRSFQRRRAGRARRLLHERVECTLLHRIGAFVLTKVLRHRETRRYIDELRFSVSLDGTKLDDAWYASLFEAARPDQLTCDFTPAYALLPPEGIEHVKRLNPAARIVYILRDPIERALSHARMLVVRCGAPRNETSLRRYLDAWAVRSRDDCIGVIDRWQARWPSEQFRVLFYDDIQRDPLDFLAGICAFTGLRFEPRFFPGHSKVVHRGPSIPASEEVRSMLRERFAPLLAELARRYPAETASWGRSG